MNHQFNHTRSSEAVMERSLNQHPVRHSQVLGAFQIICGTACIIIGLCPFGLLPSGSFVTHGIWGGICSIIAGSIQIASTRQKTYKSSRCRMAAYIGMSIIAAASSAAVFIIAVLSAVYDTGLEILYKLDSNYYYRGQYFSSDFFTRMLVSDAMLAVFSGLGCLLAIWSTCVGSQFCCVTYKSCWKCWCVGHIEEHNDVVDVNGYNASTAQQVTTVAMQGQGDHGYHAYPSQPNGHVTNQNGIGPHQDQSPPSYDLKAF